MCILCLVGLDRMYRSMHVLCVNIICMLTNVPKDVNSHYLVHLAYSLKKQ